MFISSVCGWWRSWWNRRIGECGTFSEFMKARKKNRADKSEMTADVHALAQDARDGDLSAGLFVDDVMRTTCRASSTTWLTEPYRPSSTFFGTKSANSWSTVIEAIVPVGSCSL